MKKIIFANQLAPKDGILRLHCLSHEAEHVKADSFLLELDGMLWLIDGGVTGSKVTLDYLTALRDSWLSGSELEGENAPPLRLDWVVSHFHVDHVGAMISDILPSGIVSLGTLYLPPDSAYTPPVGGRGVDGDEKFRPLLAEALEKYSVGERIVNLSFGEENVIDFTDPTGKLKFTLYPTPFDGGIGERLDYIINGYYGGDATHKMVPVAAVNSNCSWLRVVYGETRFLFTGDLMKREAHLDNEATDEMVRTYGERIGKINVLKYLHHGYKRDAAAPLMLSFKPEHIIVTSEAETASAAILNFEGGDKVKVHNCSSRNILFSSDGKTISVSE